jgi:hypothetical protein
VVVIEAVAADAAAVAAEEEAVEAAEDKATVYLEKTNEIRNEYDDFLEIFADSFCDCYLLLVRPRLARRTEIRRSFGAAVSTKTVRYTATSGRCPYSGGGEF